MSDEEIPKFDNFTNDSAMIVVTTARYLLTRLQNHLQGARGSGYRRILERIIAWCLGSRDGRSFIKIGPQSARNLLTITSGGSELASFEFRRWDGHAAVSTRVLQEL